MQLTIEHLSKSFRNVKALQDLNLELGPGLHALLGINGAGKSTLIKILCGLLRADSGAIYWNDALIQSDSQSFLKELGYLPQSLPYYPDFSAREQLTYAGHLKGLEREAIHDSIKDLSERLNIGFYLDRKMSELSGGMRQRVGIAQALLGNPSIVILDEPSVGLDPLERIRLRIAIAELAQGRLVLLATHIVSDIESIADQLILLHQGRCVVQGSPQALKDSLDGKVWSLVWPKDQAFSPPADYQISNLHETSDVNELRLVGDGVPDTAAHSVRANLEDVFLYYSQER